MDLYHMEIHRNPDWTLPVVVDAVKDRPPSAEVVFDETLHVRTWIDGGTVLNFIFELVIIRSGFC